MPTTETATYGMGRLGNLVARIGACSVETADQQVRRVIWLTTLMFAVPICFLVALFMSAVGCLPGAIVMWLGGLIFSGQVLLLAALHRGLDTQALVSQLMCVAISMGGVVAMGGPLHSGGILFFGLIGPVYALFFPNQRRAWGVFAAYMASVVVDLTVAGQCTWGRPLPLVANLICTGITSAVVAGFSFLAIYYFVHERNQALQLLREAEEKIARLLQSSPGAADTLASWSQSTAQEIAGTIGATKIGIWETGTQGLEPLTDEGLSAPSLDVLEGLLRSKEGDFLAGPEGTIVPVAGMSGELCGALVVARGAGSWTQSEKRLVAGFAHQLGAALDLKRLRNQLAAATERRALTRQEMHQRGIATLQLCPRCGRCFDHTVARCSADGSPLDAPHTLPLRLLSRYRFSQMLGMGGMGMVLSAWDERLQREVAVKLVRSEHFSNPDLKRRFEREARTVARIQHPGVIALYDSGELDDGTAFLVMERLTGRDLALQIRTHGRGTPAQVAELVRQGCAALGAAHRAGVVHRDVKPENIFLVHDPHGFRIKVLDFGLAKSLSVEQGLTQTGMLMGTPAYMSPEQVHGEELDARTDVYSFAAVCYEALTGVVLVSGGDLGRILINVLNTEPAPPSSLVPGLPPEVDTAFASALAKDRARRLKDIELWGTTFVDALASFAEEPPISGWPLPLAATTDGAAVQVTELRSPNSDCRQDGGR